MNASRWSRPAKTLAFAAMLVTVATPIGATEISAAPAVEPADTRTFATIVVNGEPRGEQVVLVKSDGVYVSLAALRTGSGLVIPPRFARGGPDRYVNVHELAPEIAAAFDRNGPTLRLDAADAGSLTRTSAISLAPDAGVAGDAVAARSGFLNYGVRTGSAGVSAAAELTLSDGAKTFFSTGSFDGHAFHRGPTTVVWTNPLARRRTTIGDVVADSGDLGSVLTVIGVSIARASDIAPDSQAYSSPTLRGTVLSPSTADVYVNGQLVRTLDVAPGTVDFSNLPGLAGVTDATIVLRDAFGRTQSLSTRYYGAPSVLSRGTTDYAFAAGESRNAAGTGRSAGDFVALGRYRLGLTQSTTVGAHAELAGGFENLGVTVDHAGRLGTWDVSLAQSRARSGSGVAGIVAYNLSTPNVWVTAQIQAATPAYTSVAERAFSDRPSSEERVSLGVRPFRDSSTSAISYSASRTILGSAARRLAFQQSVSLPGGVSLLLTAGVSATTGGSQHDVGIFLFRSAPRTSSVPTVNASLQSDGSALRRAVELQRVAPPSGGTGYDVTGYASGATIASGRFETRSSIGNLAADVGLARGGALTANLAINGAVAFAGPYVHLSQPISDSFAIVNVAGGARVKVLLDNQETGMTDRNGLLVVANLPSYSDERISIERDDGPVNLSLSNANQRLVVAAGHGGVAQFSASVVTAVIGSVRIFDGGTTVIPAFGQLALLFGKKSMPSELDHDGNFYFEDVAPGRRSAIVRYRGGECRFTMDIPRTTGIEQNIGEFTCVQL